MTWTPSKPIIAGKYWYDPNGHHKAGRQKHELRIVAIRPDANGNLVALQHGIADTAPIETLNGDWCGPMVPPL
jgi:elongation factor P hydroxylase